MILKLLKLLIKIQQIKINIKLQLKLVSTCTNRQVVLVLVTDYCFTENAGISSRRPEADKMLLYRPSKAYLSDDLGTGRTQRLDILEDITFQNNGYANWLSTAHS